MFLYIYFIPVFLSVRQNGELKFNFGDEDFKNPPKSGFVALSKAPDGHSVKSSQAGGWLAGSSGSWGDLCEVS